MGARRTATADNGINTNPEAAGADPEGEHAQGDTAQNPTAASPAASPEGHPAAETQAPMVLTSRIELTDEEKAGKKLAGQIPVLANKIAQIGMGCGLDQADAAKLAAAFYGPSAPCLLRSPFVYFAHVNPIAEAAGKALFPISGHLEFGRQGKKLTRIQPRAVDQLPGGEQAVFLVAFEREGDLTTEGMSEFLTYHCLIPQTEGNQPALALALDLAYNGETWSLEFARKLYILRRQDPVDGTWMTVNRLADLEWLANLTGLLTRAMYAAGFPYQTAQKNRRTGAEMAQARRANRQQPRSLTEGRERRERTAAASETHDVFGERQRA